METDVLVIGSGVAGLMTALKAARFARVTVVTKKEADDTSTSKAQGGIASVLDDADRFEYHIRDTLNAGAGLCHEDAVEMIVTEGPGAIHQLIEMGAHFTKAENGILDLGQEGIPLRGLCRCAVLYDQVFRDHEAALDDDVPPSINGR